MLKYLLPLCLLASPALAQQQQPSPPEVALQINGVVGTWAQTLVQQGKVIEDLQKQNAAKDAQIAAKDTKIKELEKPEAKKE
jgi:hypothetical protein